MKKNISYQKINLKIVCIRINPGLALEWGIIPLFVHYIHTPKVQSS